MSPALVSQAVIVMPGSAVGSQTWAQELRCAANQIQSRNFRAFEATLIAMYVYLLLPVDVLGRLNGLGPRLIVGRLPGAGR